MKKNFFTDTLKSLFASDPKSNARAYFSEHDDFEFKSRSLESHSPFNTAIETIFFSLETGISILKETGFRLGLNSSKNSKDYPTEPMEVFYADCEKGKNIVLANLDNKEKELKRNYKNVKESLETTVGERVRDNDQLLRDNLNYAAIEFERQKEDTTEMEEELISLNEEIGEDDNAIETNQNIVNKKGLRKNVLDTTLILIISIFTLGWIDSNILIFAFKALKFSTDLGYWLGFILSVMTVFSGYYMAIYAEEKSSKSWKHGFCLGLFVTLFIASVRIAGTYQMELRNDISAGYISDILFTGLSVLFWFLTYLLEKYRLKRRPIFIAQEEIKKRKKSRNLKIIARAKLVNQINKTMALNDAKKTALIESYKGQVVGNAKSEDKALRAELSNLSGQLTTVQNLQNYFISDIESIKIYAKKAFAESFRKGSLKQRPPIKMYSKTSFFTLVLLVFVFSGCGTFEEYVYGKPDYHITRLLIDRTLEPKNQMEIDIFRMHSYFVRDLWKLHEGIPRTKVDFYLSSIDDLFIQEDIYLGLEEGMPHASRIEWDREDTLAVFFADTKKLLTQNTTYAEGKNRSKINSCLCRNLNELSESGSSSIKTLIVISDFREHSKNSFYPFKNEPHKLVGSEYNRLTKAFSEECPLKDLTGIKVIGVYTPTSPDMDEFIQYAVLFWEKYLTEHGAEFSFRANF